MPQIFISYSRKDLTFIERLAADLEGQGCDVWYDLSGLDGGSRWVDEIEKQIKQRPFMIVVLSPDSIASEYVNEEVVFAKQLKTKKVIPLYYRPCEEKMLYASLNRIDVQGEKYDQNFNRILQALNVSRAKPAEAKKPEAPQPAPVYERPSENIKAKKLPNVLTLSNGMEFMRVPAGKFLMGSENGRDDEKPKHTVDISYDYWMARYPVTNELFNAYAKAKSIKHPVNDWEKKKDHPVVYVQWTDVMAYCQWLNETMQNEEFRMRNLVLRLPTEAEWEKAARWKPFPSGRGQGKGEALEYPWGNQFDKNKCNTFEGRKNDTTSVGLYSPQGDSPYGCADMSGNVWEWTHSLKKAYPYNVVDGREDEKSSNARVLRGGSFHTNDWLARCASRNGLDIGDLYNFGFRVVVASPFLS